MKMIIDPFKSKIVKRPHYVVKPKYGKDDEVVYEHYLEGRINGIIRREPFIFDEDKYPEKRGIIHYYVDFPKERLTVPEIPETKLSRYRKAED